MFFTIFLLLNFLIPITLNILIEGIKTFSAVFLSLDRNLYDRRLKRHCGVLNSSIVEQLGLIDCVLTDKTGTLTANEMVFKAVAIEGRVISSEAIESNLDHLRQDAQFCELVLAMALCHDVVRDTRREEYQGSSPDEVCFVNYAHAIGFSFRGRARGWVSLEVFGQRRRMELLEVVGFSSRKRMSVVVRDPANKNRVTLYTKGADSAIFEKAHWYANSEAFNTNINFFAKDGLRTLVFAKKALSAREIKQYLAEKDRIRFAVRERMISKEEAEEQEQALVEGLESSLEIIGATGIEDRLQDDVPITLSRLQKAGIRVMMITGDKLETAENIGYLSQLIREDYRVFRLSADLVEP
jgi:magnesium-transporting ATPase (P-type)